MTEVLQIEPARSRELMERVLRNGASIDAEYPLVFRDEFPGRMIAVGEGGDVHSTCAILVRDLTTPQASFRAGMIGSVSTDPAFRNHGLGTRVLVEAEAALQVEGCAVVLLWANDPSFYYARGYVPIGSEVDFAIHAQSAGRLPDPAGVRPFEPDDAAAIHALYLDHAERVERTANETAALLQCPGMDTLVLERDGAVVGYACSGHGQDLKSVVHEWGGGTEEVLALIRAHLERGPDDGHLFVMMPPSAAELRKGLEPIAEEGQVGILALGKVLDRQAALGLLAAVIGPEGRVCLEDTSEGQRFHFFGPQADGYLDDEAFLATVFPAFGLHEEVEELKTSFGLEGARFPLQPFVWGLDSI